ncbi:Histidine N-alpha-methyltransferase [Dyadobacter sp. CECT 9275]|uniref:Histidine N-alpha-methyltransferase n=1 Tax=Dyadobacter helix TaxID=2822344 RepID=A0A916JIF5_9BACT|nr:L-histidine N(alpha)-methyltransferase [Dyadobacter sp. CECT 9275]CAG5017373.1 Histidine N-alpha-methyltransferase [Dyadobacter sp. CECT 9275]
MRSTTTPLYDLSQADDAAVIVEENLNLAVEIDHGLSADLKFISSKFLYDDTGSSIFRKIMQMKEYYPTACEFEILSLQSAQIIDSLNFGRPFNIVEFGAGDGIKTRQLLKKLLETGIDFTYVPIDISEQALADLQENMIEALPELKMKPLAGDYFSMFHAISDAATPNLFLFLGSNIGNYPAEAASELLSSFYAAMSSGDKLLIGFDLQKNPKVIRNAYDDPHGITKAFNLNLLTRINRELQANFQVSQFDFYCHYDPISGEVKSYLVSLVAQKVWIQALGKEFSFQQNELIWTELSQKYTFEQINSLAKENGFIVNHNFLDCRHYFTDSLWEK